MIHLTPKNRIILTLIPVLLIMGMIFFFSGQTGEESGEMSGSVTRWILEHTIHDYHSLPDAQQARLCDAVGLAIRKMAHFSEFALLGLFLMLHILQIRRCVSVRCPWLWAWVVGTMYAVTDEWHQGFVGGRCPAATDVLIDGCGVLFGVAVLLCLHRVRKTKK